MSDVIMPFTIHLLTLGLSHFTELNYVYGFSRISGLSGQTCIGNSGASTKTSPPHHGSFFWSLIFFNLHNLGIKLHNS